MVPIKLSSRGDEGVDTNSLSGPSWRYADDLIEDLQNFLLAAMLSVASKHRKVESVSLGGKPERDASPRNATRRSANGKDVTQHTKDLEEVTDGSEPTLAAPGDRPTEAVQK